MNMATRTSQTSKPKTTIRSVSKTSTKKKVCKSQQLASKTNGQKLVARGETIPSYIREISHTVREIAATSDTTSNRWNPRTK